MRRRASHRERRFVSLIDDDRTVPGRGHVERGLGSSPIGAAGHARRIARGGP
ncbi:hypothetical protein ACFQIA_08330 [Halalkalicoccus sp. GCM10025704]